jgi:hypothetical protein
MFCAISGWSQIQINPKLGPMVSGLGSDESDFSFTPSWGFQAGGDLRLGNKYLLILGAYWQAHKVEFVASGVGNNPDGYSEQMKFQKLHVPVLGAYKLDLVAVNLRFFAGLSYSRLTYYNSSGVLTKDMLKPNIIGGDIGLGMDILFLSADLYFSHGFSSFVAEIDGSTPWWVGLNLGITLM